LAINPEKPLGAILPLFLCSFLSKVEKKVKGGSLGDLRSSIWKIPQVRSPPPLKGGGVTCTFAAFFQKKYLVQIQKIFDNFTKIAES
jgi:hypothetical protein